MCSSDRLFAILGSGYDGAARVLSLPVHIDMLAEGGLEERQPWPRSRVPHDRAGHREGEPRKADWDHRGGECRHWRCGPDLPPACGRRDAAGCLDSGVPAAAAMVFSTMQPAAQCPPSATAPSGSVSHTVRAWTDERGAGFHLAYEPCAGRYSRSFDEGVK